MSDIDWRRLHAKAEGMNLSDSPKVGVVVRRLVATLRYWIERDFGKDDPIPELTREDFHQLVELLYHEYEAKAAGRIGTTRPGRGGR